MLIANGNANCLMVSQLIMVKGSRKFFFSVPTTKALRKPKNVLILLVGPLKGGGVKGRTTMKKTFF